MQWNKINSLFLLDEKRAVERLLEHTSTLTSLGTAVCDIAQELVLAVRQQSKHSSAVDALMHEYDLSTDEGIVLMCLAEALLRIPDADTADRLIRDKLRIADWKQHMGHSHSLFVNASTWGLMVSGQLVNWHGDEQQAQHFFTRLVSRLGEPIVRTGIRQAMRVMGHQFVMGRSIEEAQQRSDEDKNSLYRYSFDMLGEAALTQESAEKYLNAYRYAISRLGANKKDEDLIGSDSISVKLSALHPRYEFSKKERLERELFHALLTLAQQARELNIALTIDAEEAERLEISLRVFEQVFTHESLKGWSGLGLAVQAYQKRAPAVIDWLEGLANNCQKTIPVRLVKGAYWDTEIKRAQERGWAGYPVYTQKYHTDLSYLVCAQKLLNSTAFYPQFATHNAHTIASIIQLAQGDLSCFEFQRLHGMGEALYKEVKKRFPVACRIYAPVGSYEDLLPYLVRRLLENGANTSFVNRIEHEDVSVEKLLESPVDKSKENTGQNPRIVLPQELFGTERKNSPGCNLHDESEIEKLTRALSHYETRSFQAGPIVKGEAGKGETQERFSPADTAHRLGQYAETTEENYSYAVQTASAGFDPWRMRSMDERAVILEKAAELYIAARDELLALIVFEGGRTIPDAISEWREAVDFLRYYAQQGRTLSEIVLPGPTGEDNRLSMHARGVFACVSPWNFPVAIFTGQIAAALVTGNTVIAKPASNTPFAAHKCIRLMLEAGVPADVLQFVPGSARRFSDIVLAHPAIAGVAFTGSVEAAWQIQKVLAGRNSAIASLIAETGGQNAMIADSSALPEQVVQDVMVSAFNSAGQRCSALRVLFVQKEIADRVVSLLQGAMSELRIQHPKYLSSDIGPVIDNASQKMLQEYVEHRKKTAARVYQMEMPSGLPAGHYFSPTMIEIESLAQLEKETFGPVLHVVRYQANALDTVIAQINDSGFGLTLGIHSRVESTTQYIIRRARVGNIYVNRNMVGAVVGVQPFGGERLSGTGPKAGGPHYLHRFCTEQTVSINTTAIGGNARLLALDETL